MALSPACEESLEDIHKEVEHLSRDLKVVRGLYGQCCADYRSLHAAYTRKRLWIFIKSVVLILVVSILGHMLFFGVMHPGTC